MPFTITDLFNAAFAAIGDETPIGNAESDTSRKAVIARLRWPIIRDAILRSHKWNCAMKRATLPPDAVKPVWSSASENYFTLPSDPYCLRIIEVQNVGEPFQVEGRKIISPSTALSLKFIGRIDISEFDSLLLDACVDALGAELALPLTGSPEMRKSLYDGVFAQGGKLGWARTIDGQEGTTRRPRMRPLIDIRRGRGGTAGPRELDNE